MARRIVRLLGQRCYFDMFARNFFVEEGTRRKFEGGREDVKEEKVAGRNFSEAEKVSQWCGVCGVRVVVWRVCGCVCDVSLYVCVFVRGCMCKCVCIWLLVGNICHVALLKSFRHISTHYWFASRAVTRENWPSTSSVR